MENNSGVITILLVLFVSVFLLLVFMLARFVNKFEREKQHMLTEMRRADNDNGYRYWHKELRCLYLRLIPFVTKRNVTSIYHFIYYKPRHAKKEEKRSDGISFMLAPSMLAVCICAICLCGVSWAWFTASTSTGATSIKTPSYIISYRMNDGTEAVELTEAETVTVPENGSCKITLTASGTAGATGYCSVKVGSAETTYYTNQITVGADGTAVFTFTVNAPEATAVTLITKWGSCAVRNDSNTVANGGEITASGTQQSNIQSGNSLTDEPSTEPVSPAAPSSDTVEATESPEQTQQIEEETETQNEEVSQSQTDETGDTRTEDMTEQSKQLN